MKPPKLWNGPSAIGESDVRSLHGLDMPFAKTVQLGSISRKRNGFNEVYTGSSSAPCIWGCVSAGYPDNDTSSLYGGVEYYIYEKSPVPTVRSVQTTESIYGASFDPYSAGTVEKDGFKGAGSFMFYNPGSVFVGDGYILQMMSTGRPSPYAYNGQHYEDDTRAWPVLVRPPKSGEFVAPGDSEGKRRSVSYSGEILLRHLDYNVNYWTDGSDGTFSLFAAGRKSGDPGFYFGFMFTQDQPGIIDGSRANRPIVFTGDTHTKTMSQRAIPYYAWREHLGCRCFTAGPGKIHSLIFPGVNYAHPDWVPPYIVKSGDYGNTWEAHDADFLRPCIPTEEEYLNEYYELFRHKQQIEMSNSIVIYIGKDDSGIDTTLLIVPGCYNGVDWPMLTRLFIGKDGVYASAPWPVDDWAPEPTIGIYYNGTLTGYYHSEVVIHQRRGNLSQLSHGRGRAFVPVYHGGHIRMLVTKDFGQSWELSAVSLGAHDDIWGAEDRPIYEKFGGYEKLTVSCVIVEAYKNEDSRGRILIPMVDTYGSKVRFMETRDEFESMHKVAASIPLGKLEPDAYQVNRRTGLNHYFVNYGYKGKSYVFPAFPGEFEDT